MAAPSKPSKGTVALKAILAAVSDVATDIAYYVDSHSGEILKISKNTPMADLARFKSQMDKDLDRFLKVPKSTSAESYGDMEAFQATVKDKKLQERMRLAVSGGGTVRNFLDALNPHPAEKERWFKFREARMSARVQDWLRQNGLSAK